MEPLEEILIISPQEDVIIKLPRCHGSFISGPLPVLHSHGNIVAAVKLGICIGLVYFPGCLVSRDQAGLLNTFDISAADRADHPDMSGRSDAVKHQITGRYCGRSWNRF